MQTSSEDVFETLNLIAQSCGYPEFDGPATLAHIVPAGHPLARIETTLRHGGTCDACSATSRIPMVTPCAHVLCVDCTVKSSLGCCVCGTEYTQQGVDDPGRCVPAPPSAPSVRPFTSSLHMYMFAYNGEGWTSVSNQLCHVHKRTQTSATHLCIDHLVTDPRLQAPRVLAT